MQWQTIGHIAQKHILERHAHTNLATSFCFVGPDRVGKRTLALEFARLLLSTTEIAHPDISLFDVSENPEVVQLRSFLASTKGMPALANKRVIVIDNLQLLHTGTEALLLKTLEEPASSAVYILVSSTSVLPTIASRCVNIMFDGLTASSMEDFAALYALSPRPEHYILAGGSPGRLMDICNNLEVSDVAWKHIREIRNLSAGTVAARLLLVRKLAELEPETLEMIIYGLACYARDDIAQGLPLTKGLRPALELFQSLQHPFNRKLLLHKFVMTI
jgi:hypothetical protein